MLQVLMTLSLGAQCLAQIVAESSSTNYGTTYQFKYDVHDLTTLDFKTHEETGENGSVRGTYTVREPNGDLRVVSYTAGGNGGFQAMVRVKPTATAEQELVEGEQETNQAAFPANEPKTHTDAPLKLQLDTGRRVYQTEQRQSNPSQRGATTVQPASLHQQEMLFPTSTHQKFQDVRPTTQQTRHVKKDTHHTILKSSKSTTTLHQNFQTTNNTVSESHEDKKTKPKLQKGSLQKSKRNPNQAPNVATAYVPYPVRPVNQGHHNRHIFAPVLLHVLPMSTSSDTDIIHKKDSPPAQSSEAGLKNIKPPSNDNRNKLGSEELQ